MKFFFLDGNWSELADKESKIMLRLKSELLGRGTCRETWNPDAADVILLEERICYKDFRYIDRILKDHVVSRYLEKVLTVNGDDCATGLFRGLYTSLPKSRFDPALHGVVPFIQYPNEQIFSKTYEEREPKFLAGWRGNVKSNSLRSKMLSSLRNNPAFQLETTESWMNHSSGEKQSYVDLILNSKFSLCPAGWAPVSFRIYESMALGRCPVILADEYVPPKGPDWNSCALFYPEKKIAGLDKFLEQHEHRYEELGKKAFEAWRSHFCDAAVTDYFIQTLQSLVQNSRVRSKEAELRRWRSLAFYWNNRWTFPQRVVNKFSKWSRRLVG